jgi:hypothetical protein
MCFSPSVLEKKIDLYSVMPISVAVSLLCHRCVLSLNFDAPFQSIMESHLDLIGRITERRSMGKHLAFAKILPQPGDETIGRSLKCSNDTIAKVSVVFRSACFDQPHENDSVFPAKRSQIPYGAIVEIRIRKSSNEDDQKQNRWVVARWRILVHPTDRALEVAAVVGGGFSYSKFLKIRADAFLHTCSGQRKQMLSKTVKPTARRDSSLERKDYARSKALRAKIFASWITDHMLRNDGSDRILDVAGGKGQLSRELSLKARVPCVVVDPLIRRPPKFNDLLKADAPLPEFRSHKFLKDQEKTMSIVSDSTCLLGLHPDEPTEDILDLSLRYNLSVAIVPCCVFPSLFPQRSLANGVPVRTYEQFLAYLLEKNSRLHIAQLPFEGRNYVIYCKVDGETH